MKRRVSVESKSRCWVVCYNTPHVNPLSSALCHEQCSHTYIIDRSIYDIYDGIVPWDVFSKTLFSLQRPNPNPLIRAMCFSHWLTSADTTKSNASKQVIMHPYLIYSSLCLHLSGSPQKWYQRTTYP